MRLFSRVGTLGRGLQELYAASYSEAPEKALVPLPRAAGFISSSNWLGRALVFFYSRFDRFDETWRENTMARAMQKIHDRYDDLFQEASLHHECIKRSISNRIFGMPVDERSLRKSKSFLTRWNTATMPFLKALGEDNAPFLELIRKGFAIENSSFAEPFGSSEQAEDLSRIQQIIDFEGHLGARLPLKALHHTAVGRELNGEEAKAIRKLAKAIGNNASSLTIHHLNKYLRALAEHFESEEEGDAISLLTNMASALVVETPQIFNQRDDWHLRKRAELGPGSLLDCNGKGVVLSGRIGPRDDRFDNNLVFEVAGPSQQVVVIGINRLTLHLKAALSEQMGFGLRSAKFIDIARDGSFALVERLEGNLSDIQWTSTELGLSDEDLELLVPVIHAIRWFIKKNKIPAHFSPEHLLYDSNGVLRCAKYTVPLRFSFIEMEAVIKAIAAGNSTVFKHLMKKSGMLKHRHAEYFQSMVLATCKEQDPDPAIRSQIKEILDFHYIDRARDLVLEIESVRNHCLASLQQAWGRLPANIDFAVNSKIWEIYAQNGTVSALPDNLEEMVLASLEE